MGRHLSASRDHPATGKRWGGGVRLDLGDAYATPLADARAAARAVKANVSMGRDPHRERMAARTAAVAERAILTQSTGDALDAYLKTIESNDKLASNTKRLKAHYVRKAVRVLEVESETLPAIDDRAIARMLDQSGSRAENGTCSRPCGFFSTGRSTRTVAWSSVTLATTSRSATGRIDRGTATTSRLSRSYRPSGTRSSMSRRTRAIWDGSYCLCRCADRKPRL